jgi:predicted ATPase
MVLEDLHWATESTLQLLHYLARQLAGRRLLMIGTLRPEAVDQDHPLRSLQEQLRRHGLVQALPLPRLSAEHVETLVTGMSRAGAAAQPLARRIFRETEGNPFFITELVRSLFESGSVREEDGVWFGDLAQIAVQELPLPTGLSVAIQARVGRLPAPVREALSIAAVLGREFDFDPLDAVLERGQEATLEALDELLRRRLIEEGAGATARDFTFSHHKIQEVVYAAMPRRRRQRAHALVGQVMERIYEEEPDSVAGELAHHFLEGRQHDKSLTENAITQLQRAGDHARASYAFH